MVKTMFLEEKALKYVVQCHPSYSLSNSWPKIVSVVFQASCSLILYLSKGADMRPHGLSSGSLVTMTTWSWLMIIFIPSTSHTITPCYFNITVQNHREPSTDGCLYVCLNNCAFLFRLRVPIGCTIELSHSGHQFLQQLFDKYDDVSPPTLSYFRSIFLLVFLIWSSGLFSIAGQRRRLVSDWTRKSVSSLSLHALGWRRLCVGTHHCWGIHL